MDSKRDWDIKLTAALWAYRTLFKVTTHATPFSLEFGIEAHYPLSSKWRLYRLQSLRNMLTDLEELDERRRGTAQNIEAIQRRRKITFDKRHKKRALQPGMMVMMQDARKLEFLGKFDALWLGPYIVNETFSNNLLQLETLNGKCFPLRTSRSHCKQLSTQNTHP